MPAMAVALSLVVPSDVAVILSEALMALTGRLVAVVATLVTLAVELMAIAVFGVVSGGSAMSQTRCHLRRHPYLSLRRTRFVRPPPIHIFQQNPVWAVFRIR